jgi:signal transduction histidine kinase
MGLRIMAYRASMIGASFDIARLPVRGTRVTCTLSAVNNLPADTHATKG